MEWEGLDQRRSLVPLQLMELILAARGEEEEEESAIVSKTSRGHPISFHSLARGKSQIGKTMNPTTTVRLHLAITITTAMVTMQALHNTHNNRHSLHALSTLTTPLPSSHLGPMQGSPPKKTIKDNLPARQKHLHQGQRLLLRANLHQDTQCHKV